MAVLAVPASLLSHNSNPALQALHTGVATLECPRGALTEFSGVRSTGKTALMLSTLAEATSRGECCALVDTDNTFDPVGAEQAGVDLRNLVWIRTNHDAATALKAADLLLHGGGFGLICLDLAGVGTHMLNRLPLSYWFRFLLAVENTPTVLLVLSPVPLVKSCAQRSLECHQTGIEWTGKLLTGIQTEAVPRRPIQPPVFLIAKAV